MANDSLARGAKSAQFSSGGSNKSELTYDLAVLTKAEFLAKHTDIPSTRYDELMSYYERGQA